MTDLISRSALLEEFKEPGFLMSAIIRHTIGKAPAVDAEPVRHARWLPTSDDNKKRCSGCDIIHLIAQYPHGQANWCPNCGAKMDAEVNGDENNNHDN